MVISNGVCVDLVILGMGADKADPTELEIEVEPDDQPVLVAFDVECNAIPLKNACVRMVLFQCVDIFPSCRFSFPEPCFQLLFAIGMLGPKIP